MSAWASSGVKSASYQHKTPSLIMASSLIISARSTISLSTSSLHHLAKSILFLDHEAHRLTSNITYDPCSCGVHAITVDYAQYTITYNCEIHRALLRVWQLQLKNEHKYIKIYKIACIRHPLKKVRYQREHVWMCDSYMVASKSCAVHSARKYTVTAQRHQTSPTVHSHKNQNSKTSAI